MEKKKSRSSFEQHEYCKTTKRTKRKSRVYIKNGSDVIEQLLSNNSNIMQYTKFYATLELILFEKKFRFRQVHEGG